MLTNQWNTNLYEDKHAFVWKYGEDLINLLSPQAGEEILDIGCGTGQLTAKIAEAGANVFGVDADFKMIEKAKLNYPNLSFAVADARNINLEKSFDKVFSNAVLHWINQPDLVIQSIFQVLKPGGSFVAEFGGKGNMKLVTQAVTYALAAKDLDVGNMNEYWYFPSISEYTHELENNGFEVIYATLFDRPTPLEAGENGMSNWLKMFASGFLSKLSNQQQDEVIQIAVNQLKPTLYQNGQWIADYRRIRVIAVKISL
ncbi:class I SAM-dependent methyltransferase [Calothrix sp. PCC 6303]|uniref:class I SAM-dependent methyltransferase n=1 Tax=Calothrix sp. PCC 6303 TaxID=1170562 RepID=UPI0002A004B1|nr:class I SAM-dependent methyltransferase [Calothrix sp. PCC 6303]AFZ02819.1 Methyltransferase type 11 [Calothrix sp. PCC 6303]